MTKLLNAVLGVVLTLCLIAASVAATVWFIQTIFN